MRSEDLTGWAVLTAALLAAAVIFSGELSGFTGLSSLQLWAPFYQES